MTAVCLPLTQCKVAKNGINKTFLGTLKPGTYLKLRLHHKRLFSTAYVMALKGKKLQRKAGNFKQVPQHQGFYFYDTEHQGVIIVCQLAIIVDQL